METQKKLKPNFSQACDRLFSRVTELLGEGYEKEIDVDDYWINLR